MKFICMLPVMMTGFFFAHAQQKVSPKPFQVASTALYTKMIGKLDPINQEKVLELSYLVNANSKEQIKKEVKAAFPRSNSVDQGIISFLVLYQAIEQVNSDLLHESGKAELSQNLTKGANDIADIQLRRSGGSSVISIPASFTDAAANRDTTAYEDIYQKNSQKCSCVSNSSLWSKATANPKAALDQFRSLKISSLEARREKLVSLLSILYNKLLETDSNLMANLN